MLSSNDWHEKRDQFLTESQALLYKSEECLSHLELIGDDEDAIRCLLASLLTLTDKADNASVKCIADFSRQLRGLLDGAEPVTRLSQETLATVKSCLALISWQLEFLDPKTGELTMDNEEQQELLGKLASLSACADHAAGSARE
ncbi:hypothetical protein G7013_01730 [Pseudomonas viridiflava]|uniref:CheA signal transduction histidine kinase n=1 Tax=Pseudomonas viridiflava TaxID=33069 RepID=A0A3M5PI41_PSEVI|nr:hypothetical protein [Pseudomonas viridiflava]MBA1228366.1 hypothetical protein [Pseudomonas viridiflava]RMT83985.1 hypothetical protein ALP40_02411 [Pseudomonas viridiflava]